MAAYTAIDDPELYMQVKLYTGTGTSTAFTLDGSEDMQPDAVWIKQRGGTTNHKIFDAVRGVQKALQPNDVDAEATETNGLTAFGSDGFTLGDHGDLNTDSASQVAWCWKESATAGFDILTFTGNETVRTVAHSLSAVPHFMLMKSRATSIDWGVYHHKNTAAPETDNLRLNTTDATEDSVNFWNDTVPTTSVFSLGASGISNNSGGGMVGYLWTSVQGFSKFGGYTGNGNVDGTFVYTGFRPAFLLTKRIDASAAWHILDNKRDTYNPQNTALFADGNDADTTGYNTDFLSNGFKHRATTTARNGAGNTYIYIAFAEAPFVNSEGVPCNAR